MLLSGLLEHHASCLANRRIRATKTRPRGYVINAAVLPLLGVLRGFEQRLAVGVIVADPRPTMRTPRRAPPASPEFQRLS